MKRTQAIGIDIGGTKMAVALIHGQGAIVDQTVLATEAEQGFGRAVDRLSGAIRQLLTKNELTELAGIGIGCAGPLDPLHGLINNPFTLTGWDRCDIVSPLRAEFKVPVYLENDADVAALGECAQGAGRGYDPVVMLTFGTGVGGASVVKGEVFRGAHGEHPEIGHIPVLPDGPECYCGIRGCLESVASGNAIGVAGKVAGFEDARSVFEAARCGNETARLIVTKAVEAASSAAWTICHTLLPQCIVLGGGMMDEHFHSFADAMGRKLRSATQFTWSNVKIAKASLGNNAGIVGAAMMVFKRAV